MWLIIVIVVVGLIIAASISGNSDAIKKAKEQEQFSVSANERGLAYTQYLRRTATAPKITAMGSQELHEFVMSNIRAYKKDCDERDGVAIFIFLGGCVLSIFIVNSGTWNWVAFLILCGLSLGAGALYAENRNKAIAAKYAGMGLDVGQLEIK